MEFSAIKETIGRILHAEQQFFIPRFQREYSWELDELEELWSDLIDNIKLVDGELVSKEYFVGSLVLIEDDKSSVKKFNVVDGQQRLLTFTILLYVLSESFEMIDKKKLSDITFGYILNEDSYGNKLCKIISESPKPYFQESIQKHPRTAKKNIQPKSSEEKKIYFAKKFFTEKLKNEHIVKNINSFFKVDYIKYEQILNVIREQIFKCQIIFVTVNSFSDAYSIFEVLNAKGKSLSSIDLIKNEIFSILQSEVPLDDAKESWGEVKKNLSEIKIDDFYRHWWISQYKLTRSHKLYQAFKDEIDCTEECYINFLNDLTFSSNLYSKIVFPVTEDWKQPEERKIYFALESFKSFNIKQVRIILLAILEMYTNNRKIFNAKTTAKVIQGLEYFHFIYNAICSRSPSGIEQKYSSYARQIRKSQNKTQSNQIVNTLLSSLKDILPSSSEFERRILQFEYSLKNSRSKSIVQYVLKKQELLKSTTFEMTPYDLSIEHILSSSTKAKETCLIGNLLPLSAEINNNIGSLPVADKIKFYEKSEFKTVHEFIQIYKKNKRWDKAKIEERTKSIANFLYSQNFLG